MRVKYRPPLTYHASYLTPGTGRLELIEFDWEPLCDDNTLSTAPNSPLNIWWLTMKDASKRIGRPIEYPRYLTGHLEDIGYEIEHNENVRIQSYEDHIEGEDMPSVTARKYMREYKAQRAFER